MSASDEKVPQHFALSDIPFLADDERIQFDSQKLDEKEDVDTFIARTTSFVLNAFAEQMRAASVALSEREQLAKLLQMEREATLKFLERILAQLKLLKDTQAVEAKGERNQRANSVQNITDDLCKEVGSFLMKMQNETK